MFETLGALVGAIGTSGFGALIGALGGLANRWMDYKDKQLMYADKKDQRTHELNVLEKELASKAQIATIEGETKIETAAYEALSDSYAADKATYGIKFVDAIRGIMRPFITMMFLCIVTYINYRVWHIFDGEGFTLTADQAFEIIRWTLFEASVVIGWWFASRPTGNAGLKLRQ